MGKTKTAIVGETGKASDLKNAEPVFEKPEAEETKKSSKRAKKERGKRYKEMKSKIDKNKLYSIKDALKLIKETHLAKFDGTVELHIKTKKDDIQINLELPHSTGKEKRIELASEATIKKLESGKIDFDVLLATAEFMPKLVPFAKILGPRGLMPNPKNKTLIKSEKEAEFFSAKSVTIKTEKKQPVIHTTVGKLSMDPSKIAENIKAIFDAIGVKNVDRAHVCASMSPSVKIDLND